MGKEANGMNRSLIRAATYVQLCVMMFVGVGCTPTQPFFLNERPDLHHYLDTATRVEYPDMQQSDLEPAPESLPPLTLDNHDYEYWDLTLEECVAIALQNSKFLFTVNGLAEDRQNIIAQFASGRAQQFASTFDPAIQQTLSQSIPLTVDNNGNRVISRGVQRASQVGSVEDALAEFDAQYSAVFSYGTTDRPRNVDQQNSFNAPLFQARDGFQQSALSKRLATGGVVTLRQQTQYSWNNLPVGAPGGVGRDVASDWTAVLEAQITHPLMRGRGTLINRAPVVLARLNEDISISEFEAGVRNLVYDVERRYWDLYAAYRNVEAELVARNAAQATAYTASELTEAGIRPEQDQLRAEFQYFELRNRVQGALAGSNLLGSDPQGVYGAERELRAVMGLEATDGRLVRPIDEPTIAPIEFDWYLALEELSMNSPELRGSRIQLKQRELELMLAKNQLLPQVDLSFTGRLVGVGDELGIGSRNGLNFPDTTAGFATGSQALAGLTEGNFAELALRLEVTPTPIGQRRELLRVNHHKLLIAQQKAFLYDQERSMQLLLAKAFANLKTHYAQIHTTVQMLNKADLEYRKRIREYQERRGGDIDLVLGAQTNRAQAQILYYRALCEYNKSIAYIHNVKGTLLAVNNIELSEGPWNKKAYWDALERARERSAGYYYKYGVTRPNVVSTGTNKLAVDETQVLPAPQALLPTGIADELILGQETVDGESIIATPIGSGFTGSGFDGDGFSEEVDFTGETMLPGPPRNAPSAQSLPELQMPQPPSFDYTSNGKPSQPARKLESKSLQVDNAVQLASAEQPAPAVQTEPATAVPRVSRLAVPEPMHQQ